MPKSEKFNGSRISPGAKAEPGEWMDAETNGRQRPFSEPINHL